MATAIPSNSAIDRIFHSRAIQRLHQLEGDDERRQLEDAHTVGTDRGPVRGFPGGRGGGRR